MCVYTYIYIYIDIHTYIYIYILYTHTYIRNMLKSAGGRIRRIAFTYDAYDAYENRIIKKHTTHTTFMY